MRISLEIAHTKLGPESTPSRLEFNRSCMIGRDIQRALIALGHEVDVALLIDDKQVPKRNRLTEDVDELLERAAEFAPIDYWISERNLIGHRDQLLNLLDSPVVQEERTISLDRYFHEYGYLPCSADIAIWHLLRLGLISSDKSVVTCSSKRGFGPADRVISVLPDEMSDLEDKADDEYLAHVRRPLEGRIRRFYFSISPSYDAERMQSRVSRFVSTLTEK